MGIGKFFTAGTAALVCRIFFSSAAPFLPWLWLAPALSVVPVIFFVYGARIGRWKSLRWRIPSAADRAPF
jgi:hypothetical protein